MVGQILYLVFLFLVVMGLYIAYRTGVVIINDKANSIPIDYEVFGEHGVPLITLTFKEKKYTFLVDSGANDNFMNMKYQADFSAEEQSSLNQGSFYGADGSDIAGFSHTLTFTHRNVKLTDTYFFTDISDALDRLSRDLGREVHGFLGTPFLEKHGMNLDVNRMIVWKKL